MDRDIARTREGQLRPIGGDVGGDRIYGLGVVRLTNPPNGVKAFKTETERVNRDVARLTGGLGREFGHLLPHREGGVKLVVHEGNRHGRRLQHAPQDITRQENSAVNRRGRLGVGERGEKIRVREDTRPLRCIHLDRTEPMAFG